MCSIVDFPSLPEKVAKYGILYPFGKRAILSIYSGQGFLYTSPSINISLTIPLFLQHLHVLHDDPHTIQDNFLSGFTISPQTGHANRVNRLPCASHIQLATVVPTTNFFGINITTFFPELFEIQNLASRMTIGKYSHNQAHLNMATIFQVLKLDFFFIFYLSYLLQPILVIFL